MSTDRPSRPQLELLSDLRVDQQERVAPGTGDGRPVPGARTAPELPAFELRVTPLSWSLPRVALLPQGAGITVSGGPVTMALTLR